MSGSDSGEEVVADESSYFERERNSWTGASVEGQDGRVVDVVLSDMSEPWEQTSGFYIKSLTEPYIRMMNTSGVAFRDHVGSMVCCCLFSSLNATLAKDGNRICAWQH